MDRSLDDPLTDVLTARLGNRSAAPFTVKPQSQRKKLFSPHPSHENMLNRRTFASAAEPFAMSSPADSRIPRPTHHTAFNPRQTASSLADALKMAGEEEEAAAAAGSPSPAPRSWRASPGETNDKRMQEIRAQPPLDFSRRKQEHRSGLSRDDTVSSVESAASRGSDRSGSSGGGTSRRSGRFGADSLRVQQDVAGKGGMFSRARKIGPKVAEAGKELARKASNSSLEGSSPGRGLRLSWGSRAKPDKDLLKRVMSQPDPTQTQEGIGDEGADDDDSLADVLRPSTARPATYSPEKSFAWGDETDFTAANLQVSGSPPVKIARTNTRLDEIEALEKAAEEQYPDTLTSPRQSNTKLDGIWLQEREAQRRFPIESIETSNGTSHRSAASGGKGAGSLSGATSQASQAFDGVDRAKEIKKLNNRALASARLERLREQSRARRSSSPSTDQQLTGATGSDNNQARLDQVGEQVPDTPITIFRKPESERPKLAQAAVYGETRSTADPVKRVKSDSPDDSRSLLRRLARAASTSPTPEAQQAKDKENVNPNKREGGLRSRLSDPEIAARDDNRLTVGFAGFPREPRESREVSSERNSEKRSSMAGSEADPIDRIEAEAKLFAPMENYSERGSVRAPSPTSEDDDLRDDSNPVEETPRAPRADPLTLPTPKVTGAYVETPATVRTEQLAAVLSATRDHANAGATTGGPVPSVIVSSFLRGRRANSSSPANKDRITAPRASSAVASGRNKSSSRTRAVRNTAKIPSVKDDLLAIHRANQIEDSTLDDLGDLLATNNVLEPDKAQEPLKEDAPLQAHLKIEEADPKSELQAYDRMAKSLTNGLLGIRTAKRGIERLEDTVSHSEQTSTQHAKGTSAPLHDPSTCPHCTSQPTPSSMAYLQIPLPRLYSRRPFRFTLLGFLLFLASLWYAAESATCAVYCRREYCYPGEPCDWSPDDPDFGAALPVKLDQWATGGKGRMWFNDMSAELSDWVLDVQDVMLSRDIAKVDMQTLAGPEERRQHRRRLRKKGLLKSWVEPPEHRQKYAEWRRVYEAQRKMREAADETGFDAGDAGRMQDDSVASDGRRWPWG